MPRPPDAPEHAHQAAIVLWLRVRGHHVFAVPNAAKRSTRLAAYLRAEGMVSGIPDLVITHRDGRRPIGLEMKRRDGKVSDKQNHVHQDMRKHGWEVYSAQGAKEAGDLLRRLGY